MAIPINIADLINRKVVENARVEYKANWNPEPIIHSICAFANDIENWGGGYIIIGVEEENGMPQYPVSGLEKTSIDRINKELLQKCNLIEPRYIPIIEQTQFEGKDVMVLWIPGGEDRPYKCPISIASDKSVKSEKVYYIRKSSNTIRANQLEEKELMLLSKNVPYDDRPNLRANIEDMKTSLISEFLYSVGSDLYQDSLKRPLLDIADSMRLVGGPSELRKPINVGLMFFNEHPEKFFDYARIEIVDKPDPTGIGMTEKIFFGPLDRQLRDALSYIQNYIIQEKITKLPRNAEAVRIYNYPYAAIEEALSNAIYHKSYQVGEPITVVITPEKMEITSLPGPDRTITDEDIANRKMVSRRYRNRRIGDFLKELKLVEGRNTGIPTILRAMEQNGSDLPIFETDEDRTYFTVVLPAHQSFVKTAKTTDAPKRKKRKTKEEVKQSILEILTDGQEHSASSLAIQIGYSRICESLNVVIRELMSEGIIEYTLPDSPKAPSQKIRLSSR